MGKSRHIEHHALMQVHVTMQILASHVVMHLTCDIASLQEKALLAVLAFWVACSLQSMTALVRPTFDFGEIDLSMYSGCRL